MIQETPASNKQTNPQKNDRNRKKEVQEHHSLLVSGCGHWQPPACSRNRLRSRHRRVGHDGPRTCRSFRRRQARLSRKGHRSGYTQESPPQAAHQSHWERVVQAHPVCGTSVVLWHFRRHSRSHGLGHGERLCKKSRSRLTKVTRIQCKGATKDNHRYYQMSRLGIGQPKLQRVFTN